MATEPQLGSAASAMPLAEYATSWVPQVGNGFPPLTDGNQPTELGDEQLAQLVSNGLVSLAVISEKLKPYFFELRERFHKKEPTAEIHGCRTWDEFCTKVLKRTRRAINYLLSGGNPASKRNPQGGGIGQQDNAETPTTENGKPSFAITQSPIDGDVAWSKEDASRRMLSWNASCLKPFSPTEKREIAEDFIAKLRDEMDFEAPEPPPIKGDAVPEPDPNTLEALRQQTHRMADTNNISESLKTYLTELMTPLLADHPYGAPKLDISVRLWRPDMRQWYESRMKADDWVELIGEDDRLKRQLDGATQALGRLVGFDAHQRPRIRWCPQGGKWTKPYSLFDKDVVRVLFDWQAAEKYPETFGTHPSNPKDGRVCPQDVKNLPMPPAPPQPAVTLLHEPDEEQSA